MAERWLITKFSKNSTHSHWCYVWMIQAPNFIGKRSKLFVQWAFFCHQTLWIALFEFLVECSEALFQSEFCQYKLPGFCGDLNGIKG
jgi:hypothetical protein